MDAYKGPRPRRRPARRDLFVDFSSMRLLRFGGISLVLASACVLAVGVGTAIIENPFFERMTPVTVWNIVFWIVPGILFGLLGGSYLVPIAAGGCQVPERTALGGALSFLAAGCPLCNKVVVLALGTSGALAYFEPVQPLLGLASVALLGYGLWLQLRGGLKLELGVQ